MSLLENLSNMNEVNRLSLMFNLATIFIIGGIIWQTGIYRQRGKLEDRLFFLLEILVTVMTCLDIGAAFMNGSSQAYAGMVNHLLNHLFFIIFAIICGVFSLFFIQRAVGGLEKDIKRRILIMVPAILEIVLVLINNFTGAFFYIDPVTKYYSMGRLYGFIYIIPLIYGAIAMVMTSRLDSGSIWLFLLIIAVRLFLGLMHNAVSSTPICLAIGLAYIQIHISLDPFYETDTGSSE